MSNQCAECDCDDQSLTCHDPRKPPLDLGICLCPSCGKTAYVDSVQELYDDVVDELGTNVANEIMNGVLR